VVLWDVLSGKLMQTLRDHTGTVSGVCFSKNGEWLFSCAGDGDRSIKTWDVAVWRDRKVRTPLDVEHATSKLEHRHLDLHNMIDFALRGSSMMLKRPELDNGTLTPAPQLLSSTDRMCRSPQVLGRAKAAREARHGGDALRDERASATVAAGA
jgi:hypothetical protein